MAFSRQQAQVGKRIYGGVTQAPNQGQVSAAGAQGYIQRELKNKAAAGVQRRVGGDGKSDNRSAVAAQALNRKASWGPRGNYPGQKPPPVRGQQGGGFGGPSDGRPVRGSKGLGSGFQNEGRPVVISPTGQIKQTPPPGPQQTIIDPNGGWTYHDGVGPGGKQGGGFGGPSDGRPVVNQGGRPQPYQGGGGPGGGRPVMQPPRQGGGFGGPNDGRPIMPIRQPGGFGGPGDGRPIVGPNGPIKLDQYGNPTQNGPLPNGGGGGNGGGPNWPPTGGAGGGPYSGGPGPAPSGPSGPGPGNGGGQWGGGSSVPQVPISQDGILQLPYNQQFSSEQLAAIQDANQQLLDLKMQGDEQALEYGRGKREADLAYTALRRMTLNGNAAGGTAYSSQYGTGVANNATMYANQMGDIEAQNAGFNQSRLFQQAAIQGSLQQQLAALAQQYAYDLNGEAGNLGFGQAEQADGEYGPGNYGAPMPDQWSPPKPPKGPKGPKGGGKKGPRKPDKTPHKFKQTRKRRSAR